MRPEVSYIPYDTSSEGKTGEISTLAHFEKGELLSESNNSTERRDKSDDNSTLPPLISESKIDEMSSGQI